ncbi:MAG: tryptophanase [Prolixibacteraceae bacterium]
MDLPFAESYRIKMVEPIYRSTREERVRWLAEAKYNLFKLESEKVYIDLLTDSGTGAMSKNQWAAMMQADESYAGAKSYYRMRDAVRNIMGFEHVLPAHQGRAAENVLFSTFITAGDIVPGNSHFDTTKGHIEFRKAEAIDCTIDEAFDISNLHPFKGNVDIDKLKAVIEKYGAEKIPMIILTVTCNSSGGQPVSIANMKAVYDVAQQHGIPVCYDSARFAENAYFIKEREEGYADKTVKEIVREMYLYADMATMSSKKDAIVNIGGFIAFKVEDHFKRASMYDIMFEGYVTYGGMAGRDMDAVAVGLDEGTEFDYLQTRIEQVHYLGRKLIEYDIPVQQPFGGHAIFIDAKQVLSKVPKEEYQAQTLACILYLEAGVRAVEIGTLLADRDPVTRENRYPKLELLRLAIPRRVYTNNHIDVVVAGLKNIYDRRDTIDTGLYITDEAPILRHFTVELAKV